MVNSLSRYRAALSAIEGRRAPERGSRLEHDAVARFKDYFADVSETSVRQKTAHVYADDAYFNDTLTTLRGAEAIENYFVQTTRNTETMSVEVTDIARSGDDYYFRWEMSFVSARLASGRALHSIGMSHIRFNEEGKVLLHQDYWDAAGGFFEHLPVVGWAIRAIKRRLHQG